MEAKRISPRVWIAGVAALALLGLASGGAFAQRTDAKTVTVFAAASLKNALDAVSAEWTKETGTRTSISYAASSALAKQIESGAPAQVFISADLEWMDYLDKKGLIDASSRFNLLGNELVLIAPKGKAKPIEITQGFDLAAVLGEGRLAVGQVDSVPAGKYAKAALMTLGAWDGVADKLAQAENVRAALLLVSRGEAAAGIVYKTDAASDKNVDVIGVFPPGSHPPIVYPAALVRGAESEEAKSLLAHLKSDKAKATFESQGFAVMR